MKKIVWKTSSILIVLIVALTVVSTALAWTVYPAFGHGSRYGGEADSGNLGGQLEFPGSDRYARASGEHVKWTAAQVTWITANRGIHGSFNYQPAMVFHAFQNTGSGCGNFRSEGIGSGWNWSNLPGFYTWGKSTCFSGKNNEIRFIATGTIVAGTEYYYQSMFRDQTYPGTSSTGMITADSYWDQWGLGTHFGQYNDFHTKYCISTTTVFVPAPNC